MRQRWSRPARSRYLRRSVWLLVGSFRSPSSVIQPNATSLPSSQPRHYRNVLHDRSLSHVEVAGDNTAQAILNEARLGYDTVVLGAGTDTRSSDAGGRSRIIVTPLVDQVLSGESGPGRGGPPTPQLIRTPPVGVHPSPRAGQRVEHGPGRPGDCGPYGRAFGHPCPSSPCNA